MGYPLSAIETLVNGMFQRVHTSHSRECLSAI